MKVYEMMELIKDLADESLQDQGGSMWCLICHAVVEDDTPHDSECYVVRARELLGMAMDGLGERVRRL